MSLVFYDTETTGVEPFFDQILQFAAIRTDQNFKETDQFTIRCRLLPYVVPSPEAMNITGVKVSQLIDPSALSHYQMVRTIRSKLLSWSPALFIGWNSLDFDEDLLRQALYKTLHNPYLTNTQGNCRSDAMRIVQAASLFAPDALVFPDREDGQKTFKLDRVAPANGFQHADAHDALGDVRATIFLCRLLQEKAPELWSSFMRFSKKSGVVEYISDERVFCLCDFFYGKAYLHLVTTIGQNKEMKTGWYVYDLSVSPESLMTLSVLELEARLSQTPKPVRVLRANAAPMLFPAEDAPNICPGQELGLEELERRAMALQNDAALRERLVSSFEAAKIEHPQSLHVEKQLYDGFFTPADERLMETFHSAQWAERSAIVDRFEDQRLRTLGRRLIYSERPDLLDKTVCREYDLAVARRVLGQGDDIRWLTIPQALEQLGRMLENTPEVELTLLREHKQYLHNRNDQALAHLTAAPAIT
jgi:exodeoxyribonuclease-1